MATTIQDEAVAQMPFLAAWRDLDSTFVATAMLQSRQCLQALVQEGIERFQAACGASEIKPSSLIQAYGNAARLCFHNGQLDCAEQLLAAAIDLCRDGWTKTGNVEWCGAALGPYTFLAKIVVLRGQLDLARKIYDEIYAFLQTGTAFHLGTLAFTDGIWRTLTERSKEFNQVRSHAAAVYMVETAKALLIAKDFHALLEFTETSALNSSISRASKRHAIGMAELRAKALAGLGRYEAALGQYRHLRDMLPDGSPGFITLYAQAARISNRVEGHKEAIEWLNSAEERLEICGTQSDSAVARYYSHFSLGFERLALGDYIGCFRCARVALACAREGDHSVGVMRARILLNISSVLTGHCSKAGAPEYEDAICQHEIASSLYGMESLAAELHLASAQIARGDEKSVLYSLARAQQLSRTLEGWGMPLPDGLKLAGRYADAIEAESTIDRSVNHMYDELMLYAKETTALSTAVM